MHRNPPSQSGIFTFRALFAFSLCSIGVLLAGFSLSASSPSSTLGALSVTAAKSVDLKSKGQPLAPALGGWSIVPSANANQADQRNTLYGVACISDSDCWAVGEYSDDLLHETHSLIEHWDGASWSRVSSPNASEGQASILYGVTCASTSDCWAVGYYSFTTAEDNYYVKTLIEHWNGFSWSIVNSSNIGGAYLNSLNSVACASASDCWAVGSYILTGDVTQTLVEHWNGISWTVANSPNTSTNHYNALNGVTCASGSDCWAVGYGGYGALVEHWNGASWSIVNSPVIDDGALNSITCTSQSQCWAVGEYYTDTSDGYQTLVLLWNGSSWTVVSSPNANPQGHNELYSVSCVSAQECWAAGSFAIQSGTEPRNTLVLRWNGISWSIVPSANSNTGPYDLTNLYAVACTSAAHCRAVGFYRFFTSATNYSSPEQAFAEHWDGTSWAIVNSPSVNTGPLANYLSSVTCISSSDCWAVGNRIPPQSGSSLLKLTLIEHWDGAQWTVVDSPNAGAAWPGSVLTSITCNSSVNCWAVGYSSNGTLIEHWNGTSWSIVTSPNNGTSTNALNSVTCSSPTDCWAVGSYFFNSGYHTLIEHWDGAAWSIVSSPNSGTFDNQLQSVTCRAASDCWAVGQYWNGFHSQTLIERWNGTSWNIVSSPNSSADQSNYLNAVTCTSASDCWAVGRWRTNTYVDDYYNWDQPLAMHWDGVLWQLSTPPNLSPNHNSQLNGVTCVSPSQCWAIGYYNTTWNRETFVARWDGTSWTGVNSPNLRNRDGLLNGGLYGVTCVSASDCWTVGWYEGVQTLIERFTTTSLAVNRVVSRKAHGSSGSFDVDLPGLESRKGGANGDYQMVFTFTKTLKSVDSVNFNISGLTVTSSSIGPNPNDYTVNFTGMPDALYATVVLNTVQDTDGNNSDASATMGVLIGDTNANGVVNSADVAQTKSRIGQAVSATTFRSDVNANGAINATDTATVKSSVGRGL